MLTADLVALRVYHVCDGNSLLGHTPADLSCVSTLCSSVLLHQFEIVDRQINAVDNAPEIEYWWRLLWSLGARIERIPDREKLRHCLSSLAKQPLWQALKDTAPFQRIASSQPLIAMTTMAACGLAR